MGVCGDRGEMRLPAAHDSYIFGQGIDCQLSTTDRTTCPTGMTSSVRSPIAPTDGP